MSDAEFLDYMLKIIKKHLDFCEYGTDCDKCRQLKKLKETGEEAQSTKDYNKFVSDARNWLDYVRNTSEE